MDSTSDIANWTDFDLPVGPSGIQAERHDVARGGSAEGLHFEVIWDSTRPRGTSGYVCLNLADTRVWGSTSRASEDLAVFLGALAMNWDALVLGQGYPRGITPVLPADARVGYGHLLASRESHSRPTWNDFTAFEQAHNLAFWDVDGRKPALWMVREGNFMVIQAPDLHASLRWPFHDVVRTLQQLGDAIAARLKKLVTRLDAVARWDGRERANPHLALSLSLNLPLQDVDVLVKRQVVCLQSSRSELLRDMDEMRAAARMMAARFDIEDVVTVTQTIAQIPRLETPGLDILSREAEARMRDWDTWKPYLQGQELSRWLRRRIGITDEGSSVEPEQIIADWGVRLVGVELDPAIEAVSVWGPAHGPAIILNRQGRRSGRQIGPVGLYGGTRATLAHEICHLLIDRGAALPVAEVLGGTTPKILEQRANAFAAEFLVPMEWAAGIFSKSPDAPTALDTISSRYSVTRSLAAQQLLNSLDGSGIRIKDDDVDYLETVVGRR